MAWYGQHEEDRVLADIFEVIGEANCWCLEVGANDGDYISNTKYFRERGWHTVLVDMEPNTKLQSLADNKTRVVIADVTKWPIDDILATEGAPVDIDLVSIDIDGQDYWVWDAMKVYRPRVVVIEFGYRGGDYIAPKGTAFEDCGGCNQTSFEPIRKLGESKGYRFIEKNGINAFFVRGDIAYE
jgi:hypothetical protein